MDDQRIRSIDEQGRKLGAAFANAERAEQKPVKRLRTPALTFGAVAAAAAVLFLAVGIGGDDKGGAPIFTMDQAVAAVSKAAFDLPGSKPGKFLYEKFEEMQFAPTNDYAEKVTRPPAPWTYEVWVRDGDPTYWDRTKLPSPDGATSATSTCERKVIGGHSPLDSASQLGLAKGAAFPKDSETLYRELVGKSDDDPDGLYDRNAKVWDEIGMAMRSGAQAYTPQQRAVLVGALAKIPDARTLGRVKDPNGIEAIGFERPRLGMRELLYFDADTSLTTYMSSELAKPDEKYYPGVPTGTKLMEYSLLEYKYLDSLPNLKEYSPGKVKLGEETTDFGSC